MIVMGYTVTAESIGLDLPADEQLVEIPADLLAQAVSGSGADAGGAARPVGHAWRTSLKPSLADVWPAETIIVYRLVAATTPGLPKRLVFDRPLNPAINDVETRLADSHLYERMRAEKFEGEEYGVARDQLILYAYEVLNVWFRKGYIIAACSQKGIRGVVQHSAFLSSIGGDYEDVLQDVLVAGLRRFEKQGRSASGWCPHGGASLATYFVSGCLYALPDVLDAHARSSKRYRAAAVAATVTVRQGEAGKDFTSELLSQRKVQEFLSKIRDPKLRLVVELASEGYTHEEIAALLADGATRRSVEGLLYRFRRSASRVQLVETHG